MPGVVLRGDEVVLGVFETLILKIDKIIKLLHEYLD